MIFKKLSILTLCTVLMCLSLVSCGSTKIPEIANVDEASAKNLLSSNGLIPAVVYEYSDNVAEGCVIRSAPAIGSSAKKNSVVTLYISKGPELRVPDIANVDEDTAKEVLTSNQLIPSITYEYSDTVIVGNVTRTEPEIGSVVEPNSKITVYLSCGPSHIEASNVTIDLDVGCMLGGYKVYQKNNILYIEFCDFYYNLGSGVGEYAGEWYDPDNTGCIKGVASLTDSYYKYVPISAKYDKKSWTGYSSQNFTFEISLSDLNTEKPSLLYIALAIAYHDTVDTKEFVLTITW